MNSPTLTQAAQAIALALAGLLCAAQARGDDLLQVYSRALEQDPQIHEAEANRDAVREAGPQSLARLLPTLAVTGSLDQNRYETQSTFIAGQLGNQNFWSSTVYLRLTQPIYHDEYWVQLSQADNQIAQAEAEYAAGQQDLIVRTAKAYFGVLAAEDTVGFAKAERRALEDQADKMKQRFEAGTVPVTDLLEAQAGFDQAVAGELAALRGLHVARVALREIIGAQDPELRRLKDAIPLQAPSPNGLDAWNELSRRNNLSLIAAQNGVEVARKAIALNFAGHLPSLDLVANVGYQDTDRPNGIVANSQTVGVQMNVPIFQGGAVSSKVRQAQHQFKAAADNLDKQRRAVDRQVQDSFDGVLYSVGQVKALGTAVASARRAVEAAELGQRAGTRTMADVLTAHRNLYRVERDHAQARYDYLLNGLLLKQGGGVLSADDVRLVNAWLR